MSDLLPQPICMVFREARIEHDLVHDLVKVHCIGKPVLVAKALPVDQEEPHFTFVAKCKAFEQKRLRLLNRIPDSMVGG